MFLSQSAHETTGCSHLLESVSSITCVMYAPISTSNPFLTQTNDCRSMEPWRFFFSPSPFFPFFLFSFFFFSIPETEISPHDCGVCSVSEQGNRALDLHRAYYRFDTTSTAFCHSTPASARPKRTDLRKLSGFDLPHSCTSRPRLNIS